MKVCSLNTLIYLFGEAQSRPYSRLGVTLYSCKKYQVGVLHESMFNFYYLHAKWFRLDYLSYPSWQCATFLVVNEVCMGKRTAQTKALNMDPMGTNDVNLWQRTIRWVIFLALGILMHLTTLTTHPIVLIGIRVNHTLSTNHVKPKGLFLKGYWCTPACLPTRWRCSPLK